MSTDYITVKTTPGRIFKGILSIPVSLRDIFPKKRQNIFVMFDSSTTIFERSFSPYESSTRECRIGGLANWYKKHNAQGNERIVITVADKANFVYRVNFEDAYLLKTTSLEEKFYASRNESHAENVLTKIAEWTGSDRKSVALNEYKRVAYASADELRRRLLKRAGYSHETVPYSMRILLKEIYHGHCQVCKFMFLKRDGEPYFEVHHINSEKGHIPKNLLTICANCHCQFTYANVTHWFNPQSWLIRVKFNDRVHPVYQALLSEI